MKRPIVYLALYLSPFFFFAQGSDSIFTVVDSNYVTLWQTNTTRNCGYYYIMDVTEENFKINWLQVNIGDAAFCMCQYDLSVTIGPLPPGHYNTDVFSVDYDPDTLYQGSTSFTIESSLDQSDLFGIVDEYNSACNPVGNDELNETEEIISLKIFPNPARNVIKLSVKTDEKACLVLQSLGGQVLNSFSVEKGKQLITWDLSDKHGVKLPPGYYLLKIKTKETIRVEKFVVL